MLYDGTYKLLMRILELSYYSIKSLGTWEKRKFYESLWVKGKKYVRVSRFEKLKTEKIIKLYCLIKVYIRYIHKICEIFWHVLDLYSK